MIRSLTILFILFFGVTCSGFAQQSDIDTVGITNGSVHMKSECAYTKFLKKYKGENDLVIHIWYNPSGSSLDKKEVRAENDEIYFLYGRNLKTGKSEMDFKFGQNSKKAFSKKKQKELTELIDFLEFDVFPGQNFNGDLAMDAVIKALD